jgi:F-type H+-transporting ATPase subunit c
MGTFTAVLIMLIATAGPSAVIAAVGFAAVKALGRNPSAAPRIFISMILAFIFAEAIAVVALLAIMNIFR